MHHKRKKPKQSRAGCMLCKPSKNSHNRTADRTKARRLWQRVETSAAGDYGQPPDGGESRVSSTAARSSQRADRR